MGLGWEEMLFSLVDYLVARGFLVFSLYKSSCCSLEFSEQKVSHLELQDLASVTSSSSRLTLDQFEPFNSFSSYYLAFFLLKNVQFLITARCACELCCFVNFHCSYIFLSNL